MSDESSMNLRRMLRVTRLLSELGHADVIEALEELKALRPAPSPGPQHVKGKYESQAQFEQRLGRQGVFALRLEAWAAERAFAPTNKRPAAPKE